MRSGDAHLRDPSGTGVALSAWCVTAAFGTYFCMYAFRKPFTAGRFADVAGVDYKTILVAAQVLGYTLSKFIGIKVIAEMTPERRTRGILGLIAVAEGALLLFGIVPPPYNFVCLFVNGLPLGMVFGLVLGYMEGRRLTEAWTAGLCGSFILADGVTKSVGTYLWQELGISEYWMPFVAGLIFVPPLLVFVAMLARIPAPSAADMAQRHQRAPMTRAERRAFFGRYAPGLTLLLATYLFITIFRSIRADFAPEIWTSLGSAAAPETFSQSEILVALGVLLACGLSVLIRDNRRAFFASLGLSLGGLILAALALTGQEQGWLGPFAFMVLLGLGLYLPYVAVHTTVFERLLAMTRQRGNIGFLMYLADAFGYLGYVAVMFGKGVWSPGRDFLAFFRPVSWTIIGTSALALGLCWLYFAGATTAAAAESLRVSTTMPEAQGVEG